MISVAERGDFKNIEKFLKKPHGKNMRAILEKYGKIGVQALSSATPKKTGRTAASWSYEISQGSGQTTITWKNTNVNKGVNIAIILQYGHGTRNGGYVVGRDYINPAMRPIFDSIADVLWKEVTK